MPYKPNILVSCRALDWDRLWTNGLKVIFPASGLHQVEIRHSRVIGSASHDMGSISGYVWL